MNFSLTALTLALTTATTGAKKIRLSNLRVDSSSGLSRALLSKASPYNRRRAEDNNEQEAAAAELDGSYSLKFSQCVDVKLYDDEFADSEYADAIASGEVTPTKSYVIFHVCTDQTCGYEGVDDLWIVDLATYLGTVATYHAEKSQKYCEACGEFEDVCNVAEEEGDDAVAEGQEGEDAAEDAEEGGEEEDREEENQGEEEDREEEDKEEEDRQEEGEGEGEGRKLKRTSRRTSKVAIDCDKCLANNCYAEQEEGAESLDEQAAEWIKKVSECEQAEIQVNGANVYYGAMCDDYGDGVELAVFLDERCSLYTSNVAFNNIFMKEEGNENGYGYLTYAENYIKTAFQDVMSCDEPQYYAAGDDDAAEEEEDNAEMNEYCKDILKDDALSYTDCEADEDAEQLVTEDGYAYDLAYAEDLDIQEVCAAVKRMENTGEYFNAYDSSTSGTWYKRDKKGQIIVESQSSGGLSGGAIFGIIAAIAAVVGGAAFFVMKKKEKKGDIAESAEYQGGALS